MKEQSSARDPGQKAGLNLDRLAATLGLDDPVDRIKLVSPTRAKHLKKMGVQTVRDLLAHFPRRYLDMSQLVDIASAKIGESCTIVGTVHDIKLKQPKPRLSLVEISLVDRSSILIVTCFRQPWLMNTLEKGKRIAVSGKVEFNYQYKRMTNPYIEELEEGSDRDAGKIIPIHPATEKLSAAWVRRLVENALLKSRGAFDPLPIDLRIRYRLPSRACALEDIHFPLRMGDAKNARRRLVYEELLFLELYLMMESQKRTFGKTPVAHSVEGKHLGELRRNLPFELTAEQKKAVEEILAVMAADRAANHMLLGDVGTGKTVVAAFALAACADTQTQAAMMAPTEVLARQYEEKLCPLLEASGITWEVLTGSTSSAERAAILEKTKAGTIDVLFGTHALLEDAVVFANCSLVVIDEQHRFGVDQRAKLLAKGESPDALFLTATPIPRTLALALYGDLTLSYIKERPINAVGNETKVLSKSNRGIAYDAALEALSQGRQVYVVCPLVGVPAKANDTSREEPNDFSDGGQENYGYTAVRIENIDDFEDDNLKAAQQEAEFLQRKTFVDYKVDLLHGKMSGQEKQEVMKRFRENETQVLVATTVIEVGVDIPNAAVMIVEDADRFGLAQLHQLRGRVGRGDEPGKVFLVSGSKMPLALDRLEAMERIQDGFELATYDLSLRKEGDILGNRQHGSSILKLVNVVRDGKVIEAAHRDARDILSADPALETPPYRALGREMRLVFKDIHKMDGG